MKRTIRSDSRPARGRRGVTLVEMLVTVAMLVIIMTILVQVFQAATGALTAATTVQQLDDQLKLLDSTIRSDLNGVTARFTPPLDPAQNLGYFEYGENEFADLQGEDTDDYIRFTAQAPPGRPFTGRMWVNSTGSMHSAPLVFNNECQPNRSPSPANMPRSSIFCATATCTVACSWSPRSNSPRSCPRSATCPFLSRWAAWLVRTTFPTAIPFRRRPSLEPRI